MAGAAVADTSGGKPTVDNPNGEASPVWTFCSEEMGTHLESELVLLTSIR